MILDIDNISLFENFDTLDEIGKNDTIKLLQYILNNYGEALVDNNIKFKTSRSRSAGCGLCYNVIVKDSDSNYLYLIQIDMDKFEIIKISKYDQRENLTDIMKNCVLKPFPFLLDDKKMLFIDDKFNVLMSDNDDVHNINIIYDNNVYNSYSYYADQDSRNSYRPLMPNERIKEDKLFRIPIYDTPNKLAFALSRYNFGLNVCAAYLDMEKKTFYCDEHINFDYPEGIAIRYVPEEYEIQVYTDQEPDEIIIFDGRVVKSEFNLKSFYRSGWINFGFRFKYLSIDHILNNVKNNYNEKYNELQDEIEKLIESNQYKEALDKFYECFELAPSDHNILYNIACYNSILNNKEKSLEYLQLAVNNGYIDWKYAIKDQDFENILNESEYKKIMRQMIEIQPIPKSTKDYMESDEYKIKFY